MSAHLGLRAFAQAYCEKHGYPGGQLALPVDVIEDFLDGKSSTADIERSKFGHHECRFSSGESYPEHCTICGVAINDLKVRWRGWFRR